MRKTVLYVALLLFGLHFFLPFTIFQEYIEHPTIVTGGTYFVFHLPLAVMSIGLSALWGWSLPYLLLTLSFPIMWWRIYRGATLGMPARIAFYGLFTLSLFIGLSTCTASPKVLTGLFCWLGSCILVFLAMTLENRGQV